MLVAILGGDDEVTVSILACTSNHGPKLTLGRTFFGSYSIIVASRESTCEGPMEAFTTLFITNLLGRESASAASWYKHIHELVVVLSQATVQVAGCHLTTR